MVNTGHLTAIRQTSINREIADFDRSLATRISVATIYTTKARPSYSASISQSHVLLVLRPHESPAIAKGPEA